MSAIMTDSDRAIEFLSFLFGDNPNGYIATSKAKPGEAKPVYEAEDYEDGEAPPPPPKKEKGEKKAPMISHAYSRPEKLYSEWWRAHSHKYNIYFCTASVKEREGRHNAVNALDIPAIWFDIDAFKYFNVPGKAFHADIKSAEDVSAWVESSKDGLQGYYKLAEPFAMNGDTKLFKKELEPLLLDIALYFGADMEVCTPARLMRLPGSLNVKPEYTKPYLVTAHTCKDNVYSLGELYKKFKGVTPDTAPKAVSFAITYVLQGSEFWGEGERHQIMYKLAGTVRKMGINKEACKNLFRELEITLSDDEFREADVDSTYDKGDIEELATLRSGFGAIADEVEEIIKYWLKLKKSYCKKRKIEFTPENYDPTKIVNPDTDNGLFYERNGSTYYHADEHDNIFANFAIHLAGKLVKADTRDVVWLADVLIPGMPVKRVEITAASHNNFQTFSKVAHLPTGISVFDTKMWPHYVAWLAENCPDETIKESTFYGWLETNKKEPTLLLPDQPHERYVWTRANEDTAIEDALQEIDPEEAKAYLEKFGQYYGELHEERYIWPALGWFAAAPMSAFFRAAVNGFPALVTFGLAGSGKSFLFKEILGPQFGCVTAKGYDATTIHAMKTHLVSNNLYPLIVDDFRDNPDPRDTKSKSGQFLAIVRAAWDGVEIGSGKGDGTIRKDRFQAPLCVVGEHPLTESATMERIFSVTINHDWLYGTHDLDGAGRAAMAKRVRWLKLSKHYGWLGTIIIEWQIKNLDKCKALLEQCLGKIEETCSLEIPERKRHGFAAVLFGLHVMRMIYADYGLTFPLRTNRFLEILLDADPLAQKTTYGSSALNELFKATDAAIVQNIRRGTTLQGSVFILDINNRDIAYFDINRWRSEIRPFLSSSASAALLNDIAFNNLLNDCTRKKDGPIMGFPKDHPVIQEACVQIDLTKVRKQFGLNTHQWSVTEPRFEEE